MGRVTVVGAGVIGLSCALRLLEAGHRVDVLARELPRETTSAVAAAIWYPYRAWPLERVLAWSRTSYDVFAAMAAEEPDSGVVLREGTEVVARPSELTREKPWWADAVPDLHETLDVPARVRRRLGVHRAGRRDAGLPRLAGRSGAGRRRLDHPAQPARAAAPR